MNGIRAEAGDLLARWASMTRPAGARLTTDRVRQWAGGQVRVALDADGHRHLLVAVRESAEVLLPPPVKGLEVAIRALAPDGHGEADWVDLGVGQPGWSDAFAALCANVINDLPGTGDGEAAVVFAVVERWRRFWSGAGDGLSREAQTGLVGELWTLLEWLPAITPAALRAWRGPLGGRHDFVSPDLSVEVKTTSSATGPVVHRIAGLHQLDDPVTGELMLLSLCIVADPLGPHTLDSLLTRARRAATTAGETCGALLYERLTAAGITPDDAGRYVSPLRVVQQELFTITAGFPRLTPASFPEGVPAGVVDVTYSLDTSASTAWRISQTPTPSLFAKLI